jgi:hypothetical protein
MKHILFIALISVFALSKSMAQAPVPVSDWPLDAATQKYTYMEIVPTDGSTTEQLFNKAKTWATLNKYILVREDKAKGEYICRGMARVKYISPMPGLYHDGIVKWTMSVYAKDGKYKYVLTDFIHESGKGNGGKLENKEPACGKFTLTIPGWATVKKDSKVQFEDMIASLKLAMSAPEQKVKSTGDDW